MIDRILALETRIRELEEALRESDAQVWGQGHPQSTGAQPMTSDELRELLADCKEGPRENETRLGTIKRMFAARQKLSTASPFLAAEVLRLRESNARNEEAPYSGCMLSGDMEWTEGWRCEQCRGFNDPRNGSCTFCRANRSKTSPSKHRSPTRDPHR